MLALALFGVSGLEIGPFIAGWLCCIVAGWIAAAWTETGSESGNDRSAPMYYLPRSDERRGKVLEWYGVYCYQCGGAIETMRGEYPSSTAMASRAQYRMIGEHFYCGECADLVTNMLEGGMV